MEDLILPDDYHPNDNEEYMNVQQLQYFKNRLLDWKKELVAGSMETLDNLKQEDWHETDVNNRATIEISASLELKTRDRYRKLLNKIDQAIVRIEEGEYGYCEETGEKIGLKRLIARPIATLCLEAQEKHETFEKQHIDEEDIDNNEENEI